MCSRTIRYATRSLRWTGIGLDLNEGSHDLIRNIICHPNTFETTSIPAGCWRDRVVLPLETDIPSSVQVLDMCAAPGSKTSQMLEALLRGASVKKEVEPTGFVIANDADTNRAYMLVRPTCRAGPSAVWGSHNKLPPLIIGRIRGGGGIRNASGTQSDDLISPPRGSPRSSCDGLRLFSPDPAEQVVGVQPRV